MYNIGLLIGRAYALADAPRDGDAVAELRALADGDTMALRLAAARYREFLADQPGNLAERRALCLLDAALRDEVAVGGGTAARA